jgi:hypothetical protein
MDASVENTTEVAAREVRIGDLYVTGRLGAEMRRRVVDCHHTAHFTQLSCMDGSTPMLAPSARVKVQREEGGVLQAADDLLAAAERFDAACGEGRR